MGIAAWIAIVSLGALLPMVVFSLVLTLHQIRDQQRQGREALQRRAQTAAAAIGRELQSVRDELVAAAEADSFRLGDLAGMHRLSSRVVAKDRRLASLTLGDTNGDRILTTVRPYGDPLPPWTGNEMLKQWFVLRRPMASPLLPAPLLKTSVVALAVPVDTTSGKVFALIASVRPEAIVARLNEPEWPSDWTASVVDQNNVIVARSRDAGSFVGTVATASAIGAIASKKTLVNTLTKDGKEVITAIAAVPGSEWNVLVGQPTAALNAEVRNSMAIIAIAGLGCLLAGIGGSLVVSHRVGRQLRRVVDAHVSGEGSKLPMSTVKEVVDLELVLASAREASRVAAQASEVSRHHALANMRERSEMLDVLAHEVRQPLNNASAALQSASSARTNTQGSADPIVRAQTVINEIQASIDNTLTVAALLARGQRVRCVDTDIGELIGVAVADMAPTEMTRVRVDCHAAPRTAAMDSSLMRLALRNLMSNALKFSPPGSEVLVTVTDCDDPLALIIDVADHGPGIEAELIANLFAKGARRATGASARDHGLGLYIVRRIMELHGGTVSLHRNTAAGTTMRLTLPQGGDNL